MRALIGTLGVFFAVLGVLSMFAPKPSEAYPTFAQTLNTNCSLCHTMVPELNAYGRSLQRTFYAPIDTKAVRQKLSPFWVEEQADGNNVGKLDAASPGKKDVVFGAVYLYAVGFIGPEFTYRVENTIYSQDQPTNQSTGPETMWLAYHGLMGGYLHVQAGMDYPGPVPAFLANPSDYENAFHIRHLAIGTHSYNLINKRLTARADYERGPVDVEIAWRGGTTNPISGGPSDFTINPGTDRSFPQWKVAYAPPNKPYEFGFFGTAGTYVTTLTPTAIDRYYNFAPYFQVDPLGKGIPGIAAFYSSGHDSNPGIAGFTAFAPQGPNYNDGAVELMEPFFKGQAMATVRDEFLTNGLGASTHYTSTGLSAQPFAKLPYVFARFEVPMGGYTSAAFGRPTIQWALQYEGPISGPLTSPFTRKAPESVAVTPAAAVSNAADIYAAKCLACHGASGQGGAGPALAGNADVKGSDISALVAVIRNGKGTMPAYSGQLSNADIAAVLTFIRTSWGNSPAAVTEADVAGAK